MVEKCKGPFVGVKSPKGTHHVRAVFSHQHCHTFVPVMHPRGSWGCWAIMHWIWFSNLLRATMLLLTATPRCTSTPRRTYEPTINMEVLGEVEVTSQEDGGVDVIEQRAQPRRDEVLLASWISRG